MKWEKMNECVMNEFNGNENDDDQREKIAWNGENRQFQLKACNRRLSLIRRFNQLNLKVFTAQLWMK